MNPDLGGPKTYGSYIFRPGSTTLLLTVLTASRNNTYTGVLNTLSNIFLYMLAFISALGNGEEGGSANLPFNGD
jgi:hypothetical protein